MTKRIPMPHPQPAPGPPPPVVVSPPSVPPPALSAFLPAAPLPITRDTPFRATGDVPLMAWLEKFLYPDTPIDHVTAVDMYAAAQGVTALVLDRLRSESTYCKNNPATNNCLGLRDRTGKTLAFEEFASPVDCVKELIRRWSTPDYKAPK